MTAENLPASKDAETLPSRPDLKDASKVEVKVHALNGKRFVQHPDKLTAFSPEGEQYPILSGRLEVERVAQLRDLTADRIPEDELTDIVYYVSYKAGHSSDTLRLPVSVIDLDGREPRWPDSLGIRARTTKRGLETVSSAMKALALTLDKEQGWAAGYACTGPLRQADGSYVFLRPGKAALTATGLDPQITAEIPRGIASVHGVKVLDIDDPSTSETAAADLEALLRFLDLVPDQPEIPLCLLSQLVWSPFSPIPDLGRVASALAGGTGSRKTAMTGALVAAQSSTFVGGEGIEVPVTAKARGNQSTVFGVDQTLYPLAGMLATVDDWFAGRMSAKEIAEGWRRLSLMGDNVATGSGGTRGGYRNGQAIVAKAVYPRACLIATAERFPDEAKHSSETARFVALELRNELNLDVLTEIQASSRALSRAHSAMIQTGLADMAKVYKALEWGQETAKGWKIGGHGRVTYGYARLLAGAALLANQIKNVMEIDPSGFLVDAKEKLEAAAADQTRRSGIRKGRDIARDPVGLFTKHFRTALAGEPFWAAAPNKSDEGNFRVPSIPGHGAPALGWRQLADTVTPAGKGDPIGAVYVHKPGDVGRAPWRPVTLRIRTSRWQEIYDVISARVVAEDGWSLPSSTDLRTRLTVAGYLKSVQSTPGDLWDAKPKVYLLDLARILEADEDDDGPAAETSTPVTPTPQEPAADNAGFCPACDILVHPAVINLYDGYHPNCAPDTVPEQTSIPLSGPVAVTPIERQEDRSVTTRATAPVEPAPAVPAPRKPAQEQPERRTFTRREYKHRFGVLDLDGIHLPGVAEPIPCELPASKSAAFGLAAAHDVKQLHIHPRAAQALKLPTPDDRTDIPTDAGSPHPWADDSAVRCDPQGVAPWMVVWPQGSSRNASRSIVLPHLETRASWAYDKHGNPRDMDARTLLRALEKLCEALGGTDYYWSPNATTALLTRRHCRTLSDSASPAINGQQVPPAMYRTLMLAAKWQRPLSESEKACKAVIRLDRNAAYLSAMNIPLGVGDPTWFDGTAPITFTRKLAGYWRIAEAPKGLDALMPELRFKAGPDGEIWLTTPDMTLLEDLGVLPAVTGAYVWETSKRVLNSLYDTIRRARETLAKGKADGDQAAALAHAVTADLYKSFTGFLARTEGPDNKADGRLDLLWRPDWRDHLKAEAGARMYRNLLDARAHGRYPMASYIDAAYFTTDADTFEEGQPEGLRYSPTQGGAWKPEGYVLMTTLGKSVGTPKFHERFDAELKKQSKRGES